MRQKNILLILCLVLVCELFLSMAGCTAPEVEETKPGVTEEARESVYDQIAQDVIAAAESFYGSEYALWRVYMSDFHFSVSQEEMIIVQWHQIAHLQAFLPDTEELDREIETSISLWDYQKDLGLTQFNYETIQSRFLSYAAKHYKDYETAAQIPRQKNALLSYG